MHTFAVVRLLLLFVHVMAFAVALGCVLREDAKLLAAGAIDRASLHSAARLVRFALIVLWTSGVALIALDTGGALEGIAENAKMLAKLTVVCVLTANGVALHRIAFPALLEDKGDARHRAASAAALGSISAASWLSATLLGISRAHTVRFDYPDLMAAYAVLLALALAFGLLIVRPRLLRKLQCPRPWYDNALRNGGGTDLPRLQ